MSGDHPAAPIDIRFERREDGLGIGSAMPRLSWQVPSAPEGWSSARAQVERTGANGEFEVAELSGARGVAEAWPFAPLRSAEFCTIRVRVTGGDSAWSMWSRPVSLEAGLLEPSDWVAEFVAAPWQEDTRIDQSPPLVRGTFSLAGPVAAARLRSTSLGLHEIEIDGVRVGNELLAPGWTSYSRRLRYSTFDVTHALRAAQLRGSFAVGAWLADGWFRGRLGWNDRIRNVYGSTLAVLVQIEIVYTDGHREVVGSDARWRAARGPILRSSLYDGERYDGNRLPEGWSLPDYDDKEWLPVQVLDRPSASLVAYDGPPVRVTETVHPVVVTPRDGDSYRVDFGQNLVGRVRVELAEPTQGGLRIRHAEVLQDSELALRPLRTAEALDTFWPAGAGSGPVPSSRASSEPESWAPRFTFHGFRYLDLEGFPHAPAEGEVVAEVLHSDMRRTGWFRASHPLLQRLHDNVVWSMRGNFVDVPTDCPQRDERLGWTGDLQVFASTAAFLYDCSGVLRSWLKDLAVEQRPSGSVPHFVPDVPALDPEQGFTTIWGDAAVLTPWDLYQAYGDRGMLTEQYPSARRWVDGLHGIAQGGTLIVDQFQYGDWLDPTAPAEDSAAAAANPFLLATAYYFRSTTVLALMARELGDYDDAERYHILAERIQTAFLEEYRAGPGRLTDDAQASYAVAIRFGLFSDEIETRHAGDRLAALVERNGFRIGTGFAGTPAICDALTLTGHLDAAYAMLLQTESPSWLYPVTMGATTIWERWDSLLPNGRIHPGAMTSFNHYALGAVADFLHRTVAGIAPDAPGYERILFQPRPGGGLDSAGATLMTPFGIAAIDWRIILPGDLASIEVEIEIPVGATGIVDLRYCGGERREFGHGRHRVGIETEVPA